MSRCRFMQPLDARAELGRAASSDDQGAAEQAYATVQARVRQGLDELLVERQVQPACPALLLLCCTGAPAAGWHLLEQRRARYAAVQSFPNLACLTPERLGV